MARAASLAIAGTEAFHTECAPQPYKKHVASRPAARSRFGMLAWFKVRRWAAVTSRCRAPNRSLKWGRST
jgi:hypothetical protein